MLIVKYTLFEAYKRKLLLLYGMLIFACILVGLYARSLSITESEASYIIFFAGFARVFTVFILGIYIIITENRNWETSRIQNILSLPINRFELLLQKLIAYFFITILAVVIVALPLLFAGKPIPVLAWSLALLFELLISVLAALMLSVLFQQQVFSIALFIIFYLFARIAGELYTHAENVLREGGAWYEPIIAWPIKISSYIVPHISEYANSSRIIYSNGSNVSIGFLFVQTLIYVTLLFFITLAAVRKRSF